MNFSLQQTVGIQFRLTDRFDLRTGFDDFHFSDAFIVPSNPGIDEMAYSAGLTWHVGRRTPGL
jgi:long-subunit fatty acid transport protein